MAAMATTRANNAPTSSSTSSKAAPQAQRPGAVLRAVGRHGKDEAIRDSSFWNAGWCLGGAVAAAALWYARLHEAGAVESWALGVVTSVTGEDADYKTVDAGVRGLLSALEWLLRGGAVVGLALCALHVAAGVYSLVRTAEPQPELDALTDKQRRLLGLDPVLPRNKPTTTTATTTAPPPPGAAAVAASPARPRIAGVGAPTYLSPLSSFLRDRTSPFTSSSSGRPPLGSSGSGRRRAYGRSRGVAGTALSFGGGADEQVQGFLEVRKQAICFFRWCASVYMYI